jgi:uncharacterized membrane protein
MNTAGRLTAAATVLALAGCFTGSLNGFAQEARPRSRLVITNDSGTYRGVTAEEENVVYVRVTNAGTRDVTGIRLSVTAPKDWAVVIEPDTLDLRAWSSGTAKVRVTPPASAADGQRHSIVYAAVSPEVSESIAFEVNVRRSRRFWRPIGAVLALVVVVAFVVVYLRYGRR